MSQTNVRSTAKRDLTYGEAGSRFVVVTAIQLFGVACLTVPLVRPGITSSGWQSHCLLFSLLGVIGAVLLLVLLFYAATRRFKEPALPFDIRKTEGAITLTFILNAVALSLAMARTGGPSCSTYGQIIPMQLAGMLLLAQQKQVFTGDESLRPLLYPSITLVLWLLSVALWCRLAQWLRWNTSTATDQQGYGFLSPSFLDFL